MTNSYPSDRIMSTFGLTNNTKNLESILLEQNDIFGVKTWNNVTFKTKKSLSNPKELNIPGTTFILHGYNQYYHFTIDCVGVYLYLKKIYPDINPLVFLHQEHTEKPFVFSDILDYFKIGNRHIISKPDHAEVDYNIFNFEHVIYLYSNPYTLFKSKEIILNLRNALYNEKEINKNKKIYISRRDSKSRATIVDEDSIEKYFEDLGFVTVTLTGMTTLEQKELFEDASIVIGRSGTSFTNLFFMNKDTKIIDISTDIEFSNYDFRSIAKLLELDYTNIIIENFRDGSHLLQKLKEFATIIQ
jgi:capsular polysaccharide biosynthesis protein